MNCELAYLWQEGVEPKRRGMYLHKFGETDVKIPEVFIWLVVSEIFCIYCILRYLC